MEGFEKDIYEGFFSYGANRLIDNISINGGDCLDAWSEASNNVTYFLEFNFIDDENNEAKFFSFADYYTYIPYGKAGLAALEEKLNAEGTTVAEMRFAKVKAALDEIYEPASDEVSEEFADILGYDINEDAKVPEEQIALIKAYFEKYNDSLIDLDDPADVAKLFCRFHHECEARFGTPGYENMDVISEKCEDFRQCVFEIYDDDARHVDSEKLLSEFFDDLSLTEEQKTFVYEESI